VRPSLLALAVLAVLCAPAQALAKKKANPQLWATVNACDTVIHPNAIGVRARMPGNGTHQRMRLRFTAQFKEGKKWKPVPGHGRSRWLSAGSANRRSRQAGWTFTIGQPPAGTSFKLRGKVEFQWRAHRTVHGKRRWVVVKRKVRITRGGLEHVVGGDPAGRSTAFCTIS
jgi:hypothetical protein